MSDVEKATIKVQQQPQQLDCGIDDETDPEHGTEVGVKTTATLTAKPGSCFRRCSGQLLKLLLSTPGLVLLVIGYSILGALIFPLLEAPQDLSKSAAIAKSREDCLRELWIITEKLNVLYERNWTMLVHEQLRRFEGSIVAATRQGSGGSGGGGGVHFQGGSASALGHFGYDAGDSQSWTFSEALLYSVTVITTIGHGSLTPRTAAGKLATIFYALVGVPLMLMCLSSLGALLADALQCTYVRLCCQLQQQHHHQSQRRRKSSTPTAGATAMTTPPAKASRDKEKEKGPKRRLAAGMGANCKGCRYDAANSETSLNDCLEYGQKGKLPPDKGEDACQLLRNLNQQQQFYQQQQQQLQLQPQQQQQPDVMLMTTTTGSALLKYAPQQQQQQLSTATLPRQHHQLQQQQQHQQLQQNFVAVPSSMLRMPLTVPPNCYAPATATIYFPFAPSAPGSPAHAHTHTLAHGHHLAANPTMANTMGNATASGTALGQQPLVKYHTIHLQPASGKHRVLASGLQDPSAEAATLEAITLPPPPAYQTGNVPAVRRAKFVTKPLPHEINALMDCGTGAGSTDLSGRHDLLPAATGAATAAATPLLTYTAAATSPQLSAGIKAGGAGAAPTMATGRGTGVGATLSDNSFMAAGVCGGAASTAQPGATATQASSAAATLSALLSANSTGTVDIMEDEDEQERERLSNCPHGTPSRVPLIASPLSVPQDSGEKSSLGNHSRSASAGAAAGFNRHSMQPLNRKTLLLTRRCQRHASGTLYDSTANNTETSDDEEYMQHGSEQFVLKKLRYHCASESEDCREAADDSEDEGEEAERQVPISLVLLILMCYICVGTVIFALWENWSLVDGAYFCFVTLSTIGYGDFVPARSFNGPELQLYACCAYLLLGLVLVAMSFSILETQLMWKCKRIAVRLKLARREG
ncbi:uncharacterized protein [Drosophila kikkawai]|uniref:Uncharacterized protein LOC108078378 n=1 Tax=Drosophila kikkawai TaxID=30033 RepID=A0A6P4IFL1_DROKI|nr:uncharacterized protein LOC108078378 [Drosophila kikkawai]XP_017027702.1 uncharacterized protein LOC108078378 [Drosophila kikkawai]